MSPVPTACRAAARDHQTDQQFHPTCTQLEPVTPVTANYPANNSILSINKSIMYISAAVIVSVPYKRCLQTQVKGQDYFPYPKHGKNAKNGQLWKQSQSTFINFSKQNISLLPGKNNCLDHCDPDQSEPAAKLFRLSSK